MPDVPAISTPLRPALIVLSILACPSVQTVAADNAPTATAPDPQRIQRLIATINEDKLAKSDLPQVLEAIHELGRLRAVEAAPALVERIELRDDLKHTLDPQMGELYPAMGALTQIGERALPAILQAIAAQERSDHFVGLCAETVLAIRNGQKAAVLNLFKEAADRLATQGKRQEAARLTHVADRVEKAISK
jgi:hypothetical protein